MFQFLMEEVALRWAPNPILQGESWVQANEWGQNPMVLYLSSPNNQPETLCVAINWDIWSGVMRSYMPTPWCPLNTIRRWTNSVSVPHKESPMGIFPSMTYRMPACSDLITSPSCMITLQMKWHYKQHSASLSVGGMQEPIMLAGGAFAHRWPQTSTAFGNSNIEPAFLTLLAYSCSSAYGFIESDKNILHHSQNITAWLSLHDYHKVTIT